ncbi:bromodomain and WD repeat-containing protein 3 [Dorcoceras hygrometricum]|uniref:Bromodomain and WD repeat-containing protein 3 n=1 Tax=Dorcoceras hygrometricum TaxID=472368 RepID=A0A2Z7D1P8_9LAMI|nr:bromodomain and WD repeat-containing protein 3 [Dorcoceras hygrometricum]
MSAGYDGKTIVWDIWEGTPIRVYDIGGRFKLVDGRFSQDGTSIVLSDDVGQIYLLNTGQGESQKDAKYDQFFLGDYRPLTQDAHGNVVDQETQLSPYRRNVQDPLCDSSMLPYPEPYQSMYQQRRLGALGIEWRPSPMKFAVGTDIWMGQEFHILPLADLDVQDPLPDFVDAMYWEPENDGMNDDNDSEYDIAEEYFSDEQDCPSDNTSIESDCSEDRMKKNEKDNLARSKRKRSVQDGPLFSSSSKIPKKKISDDQNGTSSRKKRYKKSKTGQRISRRKSPTSKLLRPQRIAARNAINIFSQMSEDSTEGEDNGSEGDSDSESSLEASAFQDKERNEQIEHSTAAKISSDESKDMVRPLKGLQSETGVESKKKLVVKFSLRDAPTLALSENQKEQLKSQTSRLALAARVCEQNVDDKGVSLRSTDITSSFGIMGDMEPSDERNHGHLIDVEKATEDDCKLERSFSEACFSWGKIKMRTSNRRQSGDLLLADVNVARNGGSLPTEEKA